MNKQKMTYFAPETERVMVQFEGHLLDGSVASVSGANVSGWDSDEEDW